MKLIKASFIAFLITMIISSFILFFTLDIGEIPEKIRCYYCCWWTIIP